MSEQEENERLSRTLSSGRNPYMVSTGGNDETQNNRENLNQESQISSYEATGNLMEGS